MAITEDVEQVQHLLHQLFDSAAAKSLAVINQDDAETEMAGFLDEVKNHPEQRPFVARLFTESFGDNFHMWREPWEFLQYCMYDLRWPEIRQFIQARKDEDVGKHGARSSTVWNDIFESFDDGWSGAARFQRYREHCPAAKQ